MEILRVKKDVYWFVFDFLRLSPNEKLSICDILIRVNNKIRDMKSYSIGITDNQKSIKLWPELKLFLERCNIIAKSRNTNSIRSIHDDTIMYTDLMYFAKMCIITDVDIQNGRDILYGTKEYCRNKHELRMRQIHNELMELFLHPDTIVYSLNSLELNHEYFMLSM